MSKTARSIQYEASEPVQPVEDISRLAQSIWEEEGRPVNKELPHWQRAEAGVSEAPK